MFTDTMQEEWDWTQDYTDGIRKNNKPNFINALWRKHFQ